MGKYLKGRNGGNMVYVICILVLFGIWQATERIRVSMSELPIQEMPRVKSSISVADVKALRGVSEKSPTALKQERLKGAMSGAIGNPTDVDVDAAFGEKLEAVVPPPVPKFDFDKFFRENAVVNAVAINGAVINGHFFETGADMELLAIVGGQGKKIVPVLRSVSESGIVVRLGSKDVRVPLKNGVML